MDGDADCDVVREGDGEEDPGCEDDGDGDFEGLGDFDGSGEGDGADGTYRGAT